MSCCGLAAVEFLKAVAGCVRLPPVADSRTESKIHKSGCVVRLHCTDDWGGLVAWDLWGGAVLHPPKISARR